MDRLKKVIVISGVAVLVGASVFTVLKLNPDLIHGIKDETVASSTASELIDESVSIDEQLKNSETHAIDPAKLAELKSGDKDGESIEESGGVGDLTMEQGAYLSDLPSASKTVIDPVSKVYKPYIDWSDGEITPDELDVMIEVAAHLYEDNLNGPNGDKYIVETSYPTPEELESFSNKVVVYAVDGVLTMNLKVKIYDMEAETVKEVLAPISVKYNLDEVELTK